jgi:glycosyltransferase involved in cell wall biosynthesis
MRISVIIPIHNGAQTLGKTLASLFAQTRLPDEVIVVNDHSTDAFREAIAPYADRLLVIDAPERGAAAARNFGVQKATGDAFFFCDADLALAPTLLERLSFALAAEPGAAFAYCAFRWNGKIFAQRPFDAALLRTHNYISTMSLVHRAAFPGFDETLPRFQDWDLWLTITERNGVGVGVPEVLFRVIEEGTMSRRGGLSRLRATALIRKKHQLAWRISDVWLALKESLRARRI